MWNVSAGNMWPASCGLRGLVESISCWRRALLLAAHFTGQELLWTFREMSAKNGILNRMKSNYTAWCKAIIDILDSVLGAFRKTMKSGCYLRHVCLSVCLPTWNNRRHWMDFHGIWYLSIFRKYVEKIQVSLKSDKNSGTVREDRCTFFITRENQNTFCLT